MRRPFFLFFLNLAGFISIRQDFVEAVFHTNTTELDLNDKLGLSGSQAIIYLGH